MYSYRDGLQRNIKSTIAASERHTYACISPLRQRTSNPLTNKWSKLPILNIYVSKCHNILWKPIVYICTDYKTISIVGTHKKSNKYLSKMQENFWQLNLRPTNKQTWWSSLYPGLPLYDKWPLHSNKMQHKQFSPIQYIP